MKIINKIFLFISMLGVLSLGFTTTVFASTPEKVNISDGIIVGDYTLESGDTSEGDIVTFGGQIIIEKDSTIYGSLAAIGGNVSFDGKITGDVVCIGGSCDIGDSASIGGSFVVVGADLNLSDEAVIIGEHVFVGNDLVTIPSIDITTEDLTDIPDIPDVPDTNVVPNIIIQDNPGLDFLQNLFSTSFMILAISAMALLVGVLFPNHLKKTAASIVNEPVKSGVLGLLTISVAPIAIVILAITIILLPVSLILAFSIVVLIFYGWVAVGYELGKRIAKAMNTTWDITITAGIGTLVLSTTAALINMIPCIGFLFYPIVTFIGLGGVLISQFGHREVKATHSTNAPVPLPKEIEDGIAETNTGDKPEK